MQPTNEKSSAHSHTLIVDLPIVFQSALGFAAYQPDSRCAERFQDLALALNDFGNRSRCAGWAALRWVHA